MSSSPVQQRHSSHSSVFSNQIETPEQPTEAKLREMIITFGGTIERDTHLMDECYFLVYEACRKKHWALIEKHRDEIHWLKTRWKGISILQEFIETGKTETALELIKRKIATSAKDRFGKTAREYTRMHYRSPYDPRIFHALAQIS